VEVSQCFRGTYFHHLAEKRVGQVRNQHEPGIKQQAALLPEYGILYGFMVYLMMPTVAPTIWQ
jgi:hypothetical protein